jgi:hypothetical protein
MWCIPHITGEFLKRMRDVISLYEEPYDPLYPVIGIDEKPKQLLDEKRAPIPMWPASTQRYDYEYIRNGSANIFVCVEPKHGKRVTQVTAHRTGVDFAHFMRLVVLSYPYAKKIRIVLDNLNTHNDKWIRKEFSPQETQRILNKIEFHHTPKHASWLNVAETEIAALETQCLDRRIANIDLLREEVEACTKARNQAKTTINWRFTNEEATNWLNRVNTT